MSENNLAPIITGGVQKAAETAGSRLANAVMDKLKEQLDKLPVESGAVFRRYLENGAKRLNMITTLATGQTPRPITGEENIYVPLDLLYEDEKIIHTYMVDAILQFGDRILIEGTAGAGKTMLMRYLFVNTVHNGSYIPILADLRRVSRQTSGDISILKLINECMMAYDAELTEKQLEYSLRLGKILLLFDGFDEVKNELSIETAEAIQEFSAKFPKNPCIITSRPGARVEAFQTFIPVKCAPLSKEQAVSLTKKLGYRDDEKTAAFCEQLRNSYYDDIHYSSFSENPLLLSMMFLTFMRNNTLPDHLKDFYEEAYMALYSKHDTNNKGAYRRDYYCPELEEGQFRMLLARICFQSYRKEQYEFSEEELLSLVDACANKLGYELSSAKNYVNDLRKNVCLIVLEGTIYRFSHRSFQAYFAAYYTSRKLTDDEQKRVYEVLLSSDNFINMIDYYQLMFQMEPERFGKNALEDVLRDLQKRADRCEDPDVFFLQQISIGIGIRNNKHKESVPSILISCYSKDSSRSVDYNVFGAVELFETFLKPLRPISDEEKEMFSALPTFVFNLKESGDISSDLIDRGTIFYSSIDSSKISDKDRKRFYDTILKFERIPELRSTIREWLARQAAKRKQLSAPDFLDDL